MYRLCVALATVTALVGCDDPLPPPSKVASKVDLSSANGTVCINGHQGSIPADRNVQLNLNANTTDTESFPYLTDGKDGAAVSCVVQETGAGSYSISAETQSGVMYFSVRATITGNASTTATISWQDDKLTDVLVGENCTLTVNQVQAGGGSMLATFDCQDMHSSQQPQAGCRGQGTFILDRCDK